MNIIDIGCIIIVILFVLLGLKRGVIKSAVQLVGMIAVLILAFTFKDMLANFLMKFLPFFNFGGIFEGITSINILIYELVSFLVIFVVLYCILNVLMTLSGIVEKLLDITVILAIPSKILGALLGLIEGTIVAFLVAFVLLHIPQTETKVMDSKVAIVVLERTPFIGTVALGTTKALEEINGVLTKVENDTDRDNANFQVLHNLIYYNIISQKDAQKLIDNKKLVFKTTVILEG